MTIDEAKLLSDEEIMSFLKQQWNIPDNKKIQITGALSANYNKELDKYFYKIKSIKSINNDDELEYPLSDLNQTETIVSKGIYLGIYKKESVEFIHEGGEIPVRCSLDLSSKSIRGERNNPMLLNATPATVEPLEKIDNIFFKEIEGGFLIQKGIINSIKKRNEKKLLDDLEKIQIEHANKINQSNKDYEDIHQKIDTQMTTYTTLIEKNKELENIKNNLTIEKDRLQQENIKEAEFMSEKLEKFRSFVKDKADTLLALEFIEQDEYNDILMIPKETGETENLLDFQKDFGGDFIKAISYIQAYLAKQNVMYPRYIIEDFFALIQTNDLIILAGESGSGKTNLIKSFAKAVGGVSKIIPVKPNWTSSEDLLGYYNPLEKKYLSTAFLDALLEATKNPKTPYFICLDEMNLARVEYYFADFLSTLEERGKQPEIRLYSDSESSHVLSEFKNVLETIKSAKSKFNKNNLVSYLDILKDENVNNELKRVFGFSDKDSLIKYHSDLRKMIGGILNMPSSIAFPKNVRIIGTINIDETTHYLSPKILDRAHIMKFDSPLLFDWQAIRDEIETFDNDNVDKAIKFSIEDFGIRNDYPGFDLDNEFCKIIVDFTKKYFNPLRIEVGLRTIRQGLNYRNKFLKLNPDDNLALNNFIIHKILPKMSFDGNKKIGQSENKDILLQFKNELEVILNKEIAKTEGNYSITELDEMRVKAEANEWIVNYWS